MKLKYINVNGYGILVDENAEIREGDFVFTEDLVHYPAMFPINKTRDFFRCFETEHYKDVPSTYFVGIEGMFSELSRCIKVIFAEPELNINVPVFNWREWEVQQKAYNWLYDNEKNMPKGYPLKPMEYGFIAGYNHNKAKYTKEQVRSLVASVTESLSHNEPEEFEEWFERKLIVLQKTPKYIIMESEKVYEKNREFYGPLHFNSHITQPKLTTNSFGKQEGIIKEIVWS